MFLKDIWPSKEEIEELENKTIKPEIFNETYKKLSDGTERWNKLEVNKSTHFEWN